MGLTDIPFGRPSFARDRYAIIERPDSTPQNADTAAKKESSYQGPDGYATFLRDYKTGKCDEPFSAGVKPQKTERDEESISDLAKRLDREKEEYQKRLGKIEELMWQHKQDERALKRNEGDILKDQRIIKQSIRQFEQAIARKKMAEEKKLEKDLRKYSEIEKLHYRNNVTMIKGRIEQTQSSETAVKATGRKFQLDIARLERDYRLKREALDMNQLEADRIAREYEAKLRAKEEEQLRLQSQMAELAIAMNVTAHKSKEFENVSDREHYRVQQKMIESDLASEESLRNQLSKSTVDVKLHDNSRRKINAELTLTKAHLALKQREGVRHLQDVRTNLEDNRAVQRRLNDSVFEAEQDLRAKEIQDKIELVNVKRRTLLDNYLRARQEKESLQDSIARRRHERRESNHQQAIAQDELRHLRTSVQRNEAQEMELFNQVRSAQHLLQKKDQELRDLNQKLAVTKRENAARLKREMHECERQEQELFRDIRKHQSDLAKVHTQREYTYNKLQNHRSQQAEERHRYEKHDKEYNRRVRISQRTELKL